MHKISEFKMTTQPDKSSIYPITGHVVTFPDYHEKVLVN